MTASKRTRKATRNKSASKHYTERLPYIPCKNLLTPGERRFYHQGLAPAVDDDYLISFKVRLADIVTVEEHDWKKFGPRIAQKHVDFVLNTNKTTQIVMAVELNDGSHDAADRQYRDDIVSDALRAAGVCLLGIPIYKRYQPDRIRYHIDTALKRHRSGR